MAAAKDPLIQAMKKLALGIGFVGTVTTIYLHEKSQENIKNTEYYKRSVEILKGYGPGLKVVGEPLKFRFINIWKKDFNYVDATRVKLNIPFTGKHKRGFLVTWASRETDDDSWIVEKLDLMVGKQQWTFFMNPTSQFVFKPTQELSEEEKKLPSDIFIEKKPLTESGDSVSTKSEDNSELKSDKQDLKTVSSGLPRSKTNTKGEDHLEWIK